MSKEIISDIIERYEFANFTINQRIGAKVKEKLPIDMTMEQHYILRYLARTEHSTTSELADVMCVAKSTITSTITRLVNKGLISREPSQEDRRVIYLKITDEGFRQFEMIEHEVQNILLPYLNKVEEEEVYQLIEILEKLVQVLVNEDK